MKILKSYSDLSPAFGCGEACMVKGIDWTTRYVRPYRCHVVKLPLCMVQRVCTNTYNSISLPHHKFLANPLPYPFSSVPLASLVRVKLNELQSRFPIAVAPIADVSNNPYYPNAGIISDHVITFSAVRDIVPFDLQVIYDIVLDEGDNYILNNTVRVL
jgi:hypothetical protein